MEKQHYKTANKLLPFGTGSIPSGWTVYNDGETEIDATYSMQYTSSDNNIVIPYTTDAFDVLVTSNTYNDGIGIFTFIDPLTTIKDNAFDSRQSLTSVTIPDSITTIGGRAFSWCKSLTSVYCKATTPPSLGSDVFHINGSGRKIYVPIGSVEAYKSATNWSEYKSDIVGYNF